MEREVKVFNLPFDTPETIREELIMKFPEFLAKCNLTKSKYYLSYSDLGNARFEKKYALNISDFISATFYNQDKTKHTRRKLGVSESDDT